MGDGRKVYESFRAERAVFLIVRATGVPQIVSGRLSISLIRFEVKEARNYSPWGLKEGDAKRPKTLKDLVIPLARLTERLSAVFW